MSELLAIALTTGILSGIWAWCAILLALPSWAGFLGCTAYFACPTSGIKGLCITLLTLGSGIFWAQIILTEGQLITHWNLIGYIVTAIVAFFMCIQANYRYLSFIPGTFIGACTTFATQDNLKLTISALLVGALFGYSMKASGLYLAKIYHSTHKQKVNIK